MDCMKRKSEICLEYQYKNTQVMTGMNYLLLLLYRSSEGEIKYDMDKDASAGNRLYGGTFTG